MVDTVQRPDLVPRPEPAGSAGRRPLQLVATRVSLVWLLVANAVGLLLATMLLLPSVNDLLSPLTYGRWMPLHMDWQLYGWSALPWLGLAVGWYLGVDDRMAGRSRLIFGLWSAGLAALGISWLAGRASGKPFLNGTGATNLFFAFCLTAAWLVCLAGWWAGLARERRRSKPVWLFRSAVLLLLAGVPWALYLTSDPTLYPPVNPQSGGATGHSLLGSTLGMVALMGILPGVGLGLPRHEGRSGPAWFWGAFGASVLLYAVIGHGNASNRDWDQILALGSLCLWPWLVWRYWRTYAWSRVSAGWRVAFLFWWAFLALNGWVQFLPGVLETAKFTNALVAHAHAAMAGMVTALNMVLLIELSDDPRCREALSHRVAFFAWNGATAVLVVTLLVQGWREGIDPSVLFRPDGGTRTAYAVRLAAGAVMTLAGFWWLKGVVGGREVVR